MSDDEGGLSGTTRFRDAVLRVHPAAEPRGDALEEGSPAHRLQKAVKQMQYLQRRVREEEEARAADVEEVHRLLAYSEEIAAAATAQRIQAVEAAEDVLNEEIKALKLKNRALEKKIRPLEKRNAALEARAARLSVQRERLVDKVAAMADRSAVATAWAHLRWHADVQRIVEETREERSTLIAGCEEEVEELKAELVELRESMAGMGDGHRAAHLAEAVGGGDAGVPPRSGDDAGMGLHQRPATLPQLFAGTVDREDAASNNNSLALPPGVVWTPAGEWCMASATTRGHGNGDARAVGDDDDHHGDDPTAPSPNAWHTAPPRLSAALERAFRMRDGLVTIADDDAESEESGSDVGDASTYAIDWSAMTANDPDTGEVKFFLDRKSPAVAAARPVVLEGRGHGVAVRLSPGQNTVDVGAPWTPASEWRAAAAAAADPGATPALWGPLSESTAAAFEEAFRNRDRYVAVDDAAGYEMDWGGMTARDPETGDVKLWLERRSEAVAAAAATPVMRPTLTGSRHGVASSSSPLVHAARQSSPLGVPTGSSHGNVIADPTAFATAIHSPRTPSPHYPHHHSDVLWQERDPVTGAWVAVAPAVVAALEDAHARGAPMVEAVTGRGPVVFDLEQMVSCDVGGGVPTAAAAPPSTRHLGAPPTGATHVLRRTTQPRSPASTASPVRAASPQEVVRHYLSNGGVGGGFGPHKFPTIDAGDPAYAARVGSVSVRSGSASPSPSPRIPGGAVRPHPLVGGATTAPGHIASTADPCPWQQHLAALLGHAHPVAAPPEGLPITPPALSPQGSKDGAAWRWFSASHDPSQLLVLVRPRPPGQAWDTTFTLIIMTAAS